MSNDNNNNDYFDYTNKGKIIKLIHTDDSFIRLKQGDLDKIEYEFDNVGFRCVAVKWDKESNTNGLGKHPVACPLLLITSTIIKSQLNISAVVNIIA